jgi:hypothetical protein
LIAAASAYEHDTRRTDAALAIEALRKTIEAGGVMQLTVTGNSMVPTLRHLKDGVTLAPIDVWPPPRGTIIFAQRADGSPVMHRVIRITGSCVILNGDGQAWMEGPVSRETAIAKVSMIRRGRRYIRADRAVLRAYGAIWMFVRPLRRHAFAAYRALKRILGIGINRA